MKIKMPEVKRCIRRGEYHPFAEFVKQKRRFEQQGQAVKNGRFHQLARKLENTIPRGLRCDSFINEIFLELINEEKLS